MLPKFSIIATRFAATVKYFKFSGIQGQL